MSTTTEIAWCDATFNPWIGCTKVSPGCAHCYAEADDRRRKWTPEGWGAGKPRKRTSAANWRGPVQWNASVICNLCGAVGRRDQWVKGAEYLGCYECMNGQMRRMRVFCASLADWLDDEVPIAWLADLLALIHATPQLDWLLLTKRPGNWQERMRQIAYTRDPSDTGMQYGHISQWVSLWLGDSQLGQSIPANVWLGTTVEDQERAEERIPKLLKIPARVRFLSCEPLLGPVDIRYGAFNGADSFSSIEGIHWVICGGESGAQARGFDVAWAFALQRQCQAAGVPFFMKQLGAKPFSSIQPSDPTMRFRRTGLWKDACFHPDLASRKGSDMAEWPEALRVREFPKL